MGPSLREYSLWGCTEHHGWSDSIQSGSRGAWVHQTDKHQSRTETEAWITFKALLRFVRPHVPNLRFHNLTKQY